MVSYGVGLSNALEQVSAVVMDLGYLAVFHHVQPFQLSTEFNGEALQAEANSKYGDKKMIWEVPKLRDNTDIFGDFWGSGARADDDSGKMGKDGD